MPSSISLLFSYTNFWLHQAQDNENGPEDGTGSFAPVSSTLGWRKKEGEEPKDIKNNVGKRSLNLSLQSLHIPSLDRSHITQDDISLHIVL